MKTIRLVAAALLGAFTFTGCCCSCERVEKLIDGRQARAPADAGRLDPSKAVEAIRAGDVAGLKRLLEGNDPNAPVELRISVSELAKQQDPTAWLRVYLKYQQLQAAYLYPYLDYMCRDGSRQAEKDAAALLDAVARRSTSLLKKGASLERPTALHAAALFCQEAAARALLEAGAAVDARDARGITPLGYASCDAVAALLLGRGAKADARFEGDLTPLHLAGDAAIARRLLKAGAAVDARDRCGNTPLHFATFTGRGQSQPATTVETGAVDAGDAGVTLRLPDSPALRWLVKAGGAALEALERILSELDVASVLLEGGADAKALNGAGHDVSALRALAASSGDWDD